MRNKGLIIFLIVILVILALAITVGMVWLLIGGRNYGFLHFHTDVVSTELVYENTYDEIFKKITIESDAGDIYVKHGKSNEVSVKVYGEAKQLDVNDNDNLSIRYSSKKCIGFCFNVERSKIEVTIPEDYDGEINIENKYGDTNVDEFLKANASISNDYGNIDLEGIKTGKIVNKCGNINIGTIENAEVENNFGNIDIKRILSSLDIEADCGDIEIDELTIDKDSRIENNMGDIDIGRTNDIRIDAHTSLGDLEVRNNNTKADIRLTIDNSCGDITVKN